MTALFYSLSDCVLVVTLSSLLRIIVALIRRFDGVSVD